MKPTILVIEDEVFLRENIKELLEYYEFTVHTAVDGQEGLAQAIILKPDLILCDVMMPNLSGLEVISLIRENPLLSTTPFIFLTAKADHADRRFGMELGADDYLVKPFTHTDLFHAIDSRLKRFKLEKETRNKEMLRFKQEFGRLSAHEFNTPINAILNGIEFLLKFKPSLELNDTHDLLISMQEAAVRMKNNSQKLLFFIQTLNEDQRNVILNSWKPEHFQLKSALIAHYSQQVLSPINIFDVLEKLEDYPLFLPKRPTITLITDILENAFQFAPSAQTVIVLPTVHDAFLNLNITNENKPTHQIPLEKEKILNGETFSTERTSGFHLGLYRILRLAEMLGMSIELDASQEKSTVNLKIPLG